jgi:hypothetical protein
MSFTATQPDSNFPLQTIQLTSGTTYPRQKDRFA